MGTAIIASGMYDICHYDFSVTPKDNETRESDMMGMMTASTLETMN